MIQFLRSSSRSGMALVITLALVVLATVAAVAFFSRATSNRAIESSRANEVLAEQLAKTGADYVAGQFLQEIVTGSNATTVNGTTIYRPLAPANAVPLRQIASTLSTTDPIFSNLIRQSASGADPFASADSTVSPSGNGRSIPLSTWNAPLLTVNGSFTSNATAPTWIYVLKNGSLAASVTTGPSGNEKSIIGRFAYNAYEIGGLLDANVAGHPTSLTPSDLAPIKNTQAGADLTALGLSANAINDLVAFRNPSSSNSTTAYRQYVEGARRSGFLSTTPTSSANATTQNNFFASRQDLIRYAQSQNPALLPALPYLTHFSRELNAPSWSPSTPTGSSINYAALSENATSANRHIPNVRVKSAFTRLDGSNAAPGEPLVKKRFPLSRLTWLEDANLNTASFDPPASLTKDLAAINQLRQANGQSTLTSADIIQKTLGLRWNSGEYRWDYVGHSGATLQSAIKNLDEVATENREPNFFETLKAGILSGSLGLATSSNRLTPDVVQQSKDFQVFRIGASAIDQVKSDSFPTRIAYDALGTPWIACGVQRLPYISRWTQVPIRNTNATNNATLTPADYQFSIVIMPILFNPFQGPDLQSAGDNNLIPLPPSAKRPPIRIKIEGLVTTCVGWNSAAVNQLIPPTSINLTQAARDSVNNFGQDSYLTINDASAPSSGQGPYTGQGWEQFMSHPSWELNYVQAANPNTYNTGRGQPVGFRLPPRAPAATNNSPAPIFVWYGGTAFGNPFQISLEYQAPNGAWYPYSLTAGVEGDDSTWTSGLYTTINNLLGGAWGDGANWEAVPVPEWRNMVPYNYSGSGGLWVGGASPNYATAEFDMVANFCQVIVKADPRSIRFNTVGSNNLNLRGLCNGGRLTRGLWNMEPLGYRNDIVQYTQVQLPGVRARAAADGGFACNESNPVYDSTPDFLKDLVFPPDASNQTNNFYPSFLSRNNRVNNSDCGTSGTGNGARQASYVDPDGVRRIADCGLYPDPSWNAAPTRNGNPFLLTNSNSTISGSSSVPGNNSDRPIILNRPFRSVAELGFVFRDQPFKTLDFFSNLSADASLLDFFSVDESSAETRAGVVNLNTRHQPVLRALLSGMTKREQIVSSPSISSAEATVIATNLSTITSSTPLSNKADLVPLVQSQVNSAGLGYGKCSLESLSRSLADATQTRTWNIFVQIVAQAGRFSNGNFIVDGEKNVWSTTAIDRPLARVIEQQYEYATE